MKLSAPIWLSAIAIATSSCSTPPPSAGGLPCAGPQQSAECIEARRLSALGMTPRPHEMTPRERGQVSNARLQRELEYARDRSGEAPR